MPADRGIFVNLFVFGFIFHSVPIARTQQTAGDEAFKVVQLQQCRCFKKQIEDLLL